jgi:uncharacterized protein YdaU (DUF1376 family)
MGKLRWYKRDPVAALEGMSDLTNEECGAYNRVLDLIYARDGNLLDDDRFIAGWCRCDVRVWRRIKNRLVQLKKIYVADERIRNCRADAEVDRGLSMIASASEAGKASARKRAIEANKNNNLASTTDATTVSTNSTTTTTKKERKKVPAPSAPSPEFEFQEPADEPAKARLFRKGKTILVSLGISEQRSGSVIGQWLKQRDDAVGILAALEYAVNQNVIEPIGYVTKLLNEHGKGSGNGKQHPADIARELADEARQLERAAGIGRPPHAFRGA